MPKKRQGQGKQKEKRPATPTFLLELPLVVDLGQAARLRAHLEVARQLYNAILSQGQQRLRRMRSDPAHTFSYSNRSRNVDWTIEQMEASLPGSDLVER
ncbi:hypothetical protein KSB_28820 [Ktedonobacter robiniae]|uniref:Transposase n=1 Tax=Ktedonobacter robiniae TaxID=2778365 RepID=A0ABQ3UP67_9CHLR|nr:hypothetical protein KSB_28820 [Ktedonobacter robiniae]